MTLIEIGSVILVAAVAAVVIWGVIEICEYFNIGKKSELMNLIEQYIDKAIDNYSEEFQKLVEKGWDNITEGEEESFIVKVVEWINKNAPKLIISYFGKNAEEQIREFVKSYVRSLLNKV